MATTFFNLPEGQFPSSIGALYGTHNLNFPSISYLLNLNFYDWITNYAVDPNININLSQSYQLLYLHESNLFKLWIKKDNVNGTTHSIRLDVLSTEDLSTILFSKTITGTNIFANAQSNQYVTAVQVLGFSNEYGFSLYLTTTNLQTNTTDYIFLCGSQLTRINPTFDYYNAHADNTLVGITSTKAQQQISCEFKVNGKLKTASHGEKTGFGIVCDDSRIPKPNWATNCIIFDSDTVLGEPLVGILPNMSLAIGEFDINLPIETRMPATAAIFQLYVGSFGNKYLLLQIN